MSDYVLTDARKQRLIEVVLAELREMPIPVPDRQDGETNYTKRLLIPHLDSVLTDLAFPGLIRRGSEAGKLRSAHFLGYPFYPDIMVDWRSMPVLAIEVKLLREGSRQNAIATALGQSQIYRKRYHRTAMMLIDSKPSSTSEDRGEAVEWMASSLGTSLVIRQRASTGDSFLEPHL